MVTWSKKLGDKLKNLKEREEKRGKIKKKNKRGLNKIINKTLVFLLKMPFISKTISKDISSVVMKEYDLESNKITEDLSILFISDLHLEVVDNIEATEVLLKDSTFDYVILGGDIFDKDISLNSNEKKFKRLINLLKKHSKNGIISILGNHDGINVSKKLDENTILLINDDYEDEQIFIYGTEDYVTFKETEDRETAIPDSKFTVLLSHTPNFYEKKKNDYDLMLSGHTHGGQVSIFNYAPLNYCSDKKMIYGYWEKENLKGITTSGLGCSGLPVRVGVLPEIVKIKIKKSF